MMMSPKKKIATIILGKLKPSEDEKPEFVQEIGEVEEDAVPMDKPEVDDSLAVKSAAEDVISAMKKEDAGMFVEAMKNLLELMDSEEDKEEEEYE